jgi:hypothetical protein
MGQHERAVRSWKKTMSRPWPVKVLAKTTREEAGFLSKCDQGWRNSKADIIGYLHSDLIIHEFGWDVRVLHEFANEKVAVVGIVGAMQLASDDIYKVRYDFKQLARADVYSNLTDFAAHGKRETGTCRVAVVDSCAVFVRSSFLGEIGGWPIASYPNNSHCSDLWLSCSAHRHSYLVHLVGIEATHSSGGKGEAGVKWCNEHGGDDVMHKRAHRICYEDFRDVLPVRIFS